MTLEEELEFALEQERDSAAIDGHGFDEAAFRQAWLEAMANREAIKLQFTESRQTPIAPKDIESYNPRLSDIRGDHDFRAADLAALAAIEITHVNDLLSLPKAKLQNVYDSLPEPMFDKKISLHDFKRTINDLKEAFPKAHYFLAQPVRQTQSPESEKAALPCRPDGGRDGSGYMM